jgi:hypothetical protein
VTLGIAMEGTASVRKKLLSIDPGIGGLTRLERRGARRRA